MRKCWEFLKKLPSFFLVSLRISFRIGGDALKKISARAMPLKLRHVVGMIGVVVITLGVILAEHGTSEVKEGNTWLSGVVIAILILLVLSLGAVALFRLLLRAKPRDNGDRAAVLQAQPGRTDPAKQKGKKPRLRTILILLAIVAGGYCIVRYSGTAWLRGKQRPSVTKVGGYNPSMVLPGTIDLRKKEGNSFLLQVPMGEWSKKIIFPERMSKGMCYQPATLADAQNKSWWIAFVILRQDGSITTLTRAYRWGEHPSFFDPPLPITLRIQGDAPHGILFEKGIRDPKTGFCIPTV